MTRSPTHNRRWVWALAVAIAAITVHWYAVKPDVLGAVVGGGIVGSPLFAPLTFALGFLFLGAVPAVVAPALYRVSLRQLGLGPGHVRRGALLLAAALPIAIVAGLVGARSPDLASTYPIGHHVTRALGSFLPHALSYGLYYVGFEFLFRGFLLLGLADRMGATRANLLQSVLAVVAHVGKPGVEILAAFPGSLLFGWITLTTRSIWWATAIHWMVGVSLDWFLL